MTSTVEESTAAARRLVGELEALGALVDVVLPDGVHLYWSTHCRHGKHHPCDATVLNDGPRRPAQCKECAAACRCPHHSAGTPAAEPATD
jgi:hypothetical protein